MYQIDNAKLNRSLPVVPQIAADLRSQILSLDIKPNAVLSRPDLQAVYKVSLTPIRDALIQLMEEGLVRIYPQAGTYVTPISLVRAHQGHFLRSAIEFELVRRLAEEPDAALVDTLNAIVEKQTAVVSHTDFEQFERLDRKFHWTMFTAGRMDPLWETVRRSSGDIDRLRRLTLPRPGKMERIIEGHAAIIACIASGNPESAYQAMRAHLSETLSLADQVRSANPDYFVD